MNITEKTLLTTLTVAALSGGVISIDKLTSGDAEETGNSTGKTAETTEYVDNVKPIPVRVPKVRVFKLTSQTLPQKKVMHNLNNSSICRRISQNNGVVF